MRLHEEGKKEIVEQNMIILWTIATVEDMVMRFCHLQTATNHATISNILVFILDFSVSELNYLLRCDIACLMLFEYFFMGVMTIFSSVDTIPSEFAFVDFDRARLRRIVSQ